MYDNEPSLQFYLLKAHEGNENEHQCVCSDHASLDS